MKRNELSFFVELNHLYDQIGETIKQDYYKIYDDVGKENNWEEEDYDSVKNADLYDIILEAVIFINFYRKRIYMLF